MADHVKRTTRAQVEPARLPPTESSARNLDAPARLRETSLLQQRVLALELEVEQRKELEAALRRALSEYEQLLAERERLLARELAARADAEEAVRSRDDFVAVVSHELRNPVNALQLQLLSVRRLIGRDPSFPASDAAMERLTRMEDQVARLIRLINNLLDLSRIRAGRFDLMCEPLDFVRVVTEVVEEFEEVEGGGEIRIHSPASIGWHGDRTRIEQVITNLISNAVKYGAGKPIDVSVSADDEQVRLEVADRGPGISPEAQHQLFQRFARIGHEYGQGGVGLGLWITRQVLDAMGGRIDAQSGRDGGTMVTVELPRFVA